LADDLSSSDDDGFDPQEFTAVKEMLDAENAEEKPTKKYTNNKVGLLAKLDEISLPEKMPWIEKLDFVTAAPVVVENPHDDLKREAEFYTQTLRGVTTAILQFEQARIPYMRPADYFAEMIKPDSQMQRIKDSLLKEKKKMDISAVRQKEKEQRKYAQAVHSEKLQERAKSKRDTMDILAQHKKMGREGKLEKERSMVGSINTALEQGRKETEDKREKHRNKKRERADKKYGHGKKNKFKKANNAESSADMSGFSVSRNKKRAASMGNKKRPGKAARAAKR